MQDKFQLDNIVYRTMVTSATFSRADGLWHLEVKDLTTGESRQRTCNVLLSCLGGLTIPNRPPFDPAKFAGPVFHSAEWPEDIDLKDKRVVIVGNGALNSLSSAPVFPSLSRRAKSHRPPEHSFVVENGPRQHADEYGLFLPPLTAERLQRGPDPARDLQGREISHAGRAFAPDVFQADRGPGQAVPPLADALHSRCTCHRTPLARVPKRGLTTCLSLSLSLSPRNLVPAQVGRIMRALMFLITESVWKVSDIKRGAKGRADSEKELLAQ